MKRSRQMFIVAGIFAVLSVALISPDMFHIGTLFFVCLILINEVEKKKKAVEK